MRSIVLSLFGFVVLGTHSVFGMTFAKNKHLKGIFESLFLCVQMQVSFTALLRGSMLTNTRRHAISTFCALTAL